MSSETASVSKLMNIKVQTDYENQNIMGPCNSMSANNVVCVIIVTPPITEVLSVLLLNVILLKF